MSSTLKYRDLTVAIMFAVGLAAVLGLINLYGSHPAVFSALSHLAIGFVGGSLVVFRIISLLAMRNFAHAPASAQRRHASISYCILGVAVAIGALINFPVASALALALGYYLGILFGALVMEVEQERRQQQSNTIC